MSHRFALVRNGKVENVIELEPGSNWKAPEGVELVAADTAGPGDSYANGAFTPAPQIVEPREPELVSVASGLVQIGGGLVATSVLSGFAIAQRRGAGKLRCLFVTPQPDNKYLVFATCHLPTGPVNCSVATMDARYVEIVSAVEGAAYSIEVERIV